MSEALFTAITHVYSHGRGAREIAISSLSPSGFELLHELFFFATGIELEDTGIFEAANDVDHLLLDGFDDR